MSIHPIPCKTCHRSNAPWRRHCGGCGSGLAGACRCGFVNGGADRFCGACGNAVRPITSSTIRLDTLDDVLVRE